ncbi:hypothetical protein A7E78_13470 [Syntrophotalea acetylenivorans]|uniref:Uncharacterized protein n=1 Tax=Syntrophotalea acetylenivorans TaxID=1842532 RepID=A0A1L3GS43_9BACT|nr:hypothetical protein A7E78_13470 [Syntrophotalea acetylenivorans]
MKPPSPWHFLVEVIFSLTNNLLLHAVEPFFAYFLLARTKSRASGGTRPAGFSFELLPATMQDS